MIENGIDRKSLATFSACEGRRTRTRIPLHRSIAGLQITATRLLFLPTLTQSDGLVFPSVPSDLSQRVSTLPLFSIQAVKPLNQQITCDEEPFS